MQQGQKPLRLLTTAKEEFKLGQEPENKLELIAFKEFKSYPDMYKVIDFLNKNLKDKKLLFGLSKTETGNMLISIYET